LKCDFKTVNELFTAKIVLNESGSLDGRKTVMAVLLASITTMTETKQTAKRTF